MPKTDRILSVIGIVAGGKSVKVFSSPVTEFKVKINLGRNTYFSDVYNSNTGLVCFQVAGNAVKRAADNLVRAAKKAAIFEEEETTVIINQRFVGGIAQELEAQEHVLRIEKELELARMKLGKIRQARYVPEDED